MPIKPKSKPNIWYKPKVNINGQWSSNNDNRYHSARWRTLRSVVLKSNPLCVMCKVNNKITAATIADHIKAVRLGGEFWNLNNIQSLCVTCHNAKRD